MTRRFVFARHRSGFDLHWSGADNGWVRRRRSCFNKLGTHDVPFTLKGGEPEPIHFLRRRTENPTPESKKAQSTVAAVRGLNRRVRGALRGS